MYEIDFTNKNLPTYIHSVDSRAFDVLYYVVVFFAKQWKTGIQSQTLFSFFQQLCKSLPLSTVVYKM